MRGCPFQGVVSACDRGSGSRTYCPMLKRERLKGDERLFPFCLKQCQARKQSSQSKRPCQRSFSANARKSSTSLPRIGAAANFNLGRGDGRDLAIKLDCPKGTQQSMFNVAHIHGPIDGCVLLEWPQSVLRLCQFISIVGHLTRASSEKRAKPSLDKLATPPPKRPCQLRRYRSQTLQLAISLSFMVSGQR